MYIFNISYDLKLTALTPPPLKKDPTCEEFHAWPCQSWELIELCLILVLYPSDCSSYHYPTDPNNRGIGIEGGL